MYLLNVVGIKDVLSHSRIKDVLNFARIEYLPGFTFLESRIS